MWDRENGDEDDLLFKSGSPVESGQLKFNVTMVTTVCIDGL